MEPTAPESHKGRGVSALGALGDSGGAGERGTPGPGGQGGSDPVRTPSPLPGTDRRGQTQDLPAPEKWGPIPVTVSLVPAPKWRGEL